MQKNGKFKGILQKNWYPQHGGYNFFSGKAHFCVFPWNLNNIFLSNCIIMNYIFTGLGKGTYKLHILHKGNKEWFEVQDLHVKEILPPMITLSESYIQVKSF